MLSLSVVAFSGALAAAQFVPPPPFSTLTATMSGVLPEIPPGFTGVPTEEGAIVAQAAPNPTHTGVFGPAIVQGNLPAATYTATLPSVAFDELTGTIPAGTIIGSSSQGASGVTFTINLSGLPAQAQYGPLMYHIHNLPVPADGNCTSTMGHFDVTDVGEYYMCDTAMPQNCQTGDLAGKHGKIMTSPTFSTSFVEPYLSTDPNSRYFFGGKSIVIHSSNTTRLTCANFVRSSGSASVSSAAAAGPAATAASTTGAAVTPSPSPLYSSSANDVAISSAVVGLAAMVACLL